jgi:hypothetical protein
MLTDRAKEFAEHAERLLDDGNKHRDLQTLATAALCALASIQISEPPRGEPLDLETDPWAVHRATGAAPVCDHNPGATGVCRKCGWDVVRDAWPE